MGQRARVPGRELSLGALHCCSTVLLYMQGDSEVDTGGRKDSCLLQTRYDTKAQGSRPYRSQKWPGGAPGL